MANTKFTVKLSGTDGNNIVYYGYNCPREGEWLRLNGLDYPVINVTHVPNLPYTANCWEEVILDVGRGR